MSEVIGQQLDFPDGNYDGGLTVEDKPPEVKWAIAGRSAVPELFNWVARKTTEDLQTIREYLSEYESVRKLTPLAELTQIAGKEADIIYVHEWQPVYSYDAVSQTEVGGSVDLIRTEPKIVVEWSCPDVVNATNPIIHVDVDISGIGQEPGGATISTSQELSIPTNNNEIQESVFDLGDVSEGDSNGDGWDDVRGKELTVFVSRDPDDTQVGRWQLHSVEVR